MRGCLRYIDRGKVRLQRNTRYVWIGGVEGQNIMSIESLPAGLLVFFLGHSIKNSDDTWLIHAYVTISIHLKRGSQQITRERMGGLFLSHVPVK